jgi:hypothetical protein
MVPPIAFEEGYLMCMLLGTKQVICGLHCLPLLILLRLTVKFGAQHLVSQLNFFLWCANRQSQNPMRPELGVVAIHPLGTYAIKLVLGTGSRLPPLLSAVGLRLLLRRSFGLSPKRNVPASISHYYYLNMPAIPCTSWTTLAGCRILHEFAKLRALKGDRSIQKTLYRVSLLGA